MSLLEFQNVSFDNEGKTILKNISVSIKQGDFISIVGPSGSGKSTFLKLCNNLISPAAGSIMYKGKNINEYNPTELRKSIAYCFQTPCLFGDMVIENIKFPFSIRNAKLDQNRASELFSLFHMSSDYLDKGVRNLSGGEKQRIALIRNLLFKPEALLLDEITSALDTDNTQIVENVIASLNKEGVTILWITHNREQSRKYANKLLTIETGEIKSLEVIK
ncbi:putative ABC transport system ATP-binding protein [Anaerobacterium chartisolvens]|uniref:Putative ABC transport system ATP-binding protein n=1 Tax=Anaerobacterium chartisolvens TaxID=1297424 RepID=A0A369B199_9FIRM|nr:ATP-binding cassette domain-containing protein [Anaerobacterium chartisolvens]RCX14348.1 putative ABC transport system ATP-binding protein [Anaerobacterium chartisolvens]